MTSKRHVRRHMCGNKTRHTDRAAALAHLHSLLRNGKKRDGWMMTYKCKFCGKWHIGHGRENV